MFCFIRMMRETIVEISHCSRLNVSSLFVAKPFMDCELILDAAVCR
jgi:hypothetical protein